MFTSSDIKRHIREYLENGGTIKHLDNAGNVEYETCADCLVDVRTQKPAVIGQPVKSFRGEKGILKHIWRPAHGGAEGNVTVLVQGVEKYNYASVWGLEFINRTDQ